MYNFRPVFLLPQIQILLTKPIKHILGVVGDNTDRDSISKRTHVSAKMPELSPQLLAERSKTPQSNFHRFLKEMMFSKNLKKSGQFTAKTISLPVYPPMT